MSDIHFSNVSLLLSMEGSNGSTTIVDGSQSPKTVSAFGNAQLSTSIKKFGDSSLWLDGSSYCSSPPNADYSFGAGDFTIEAWIYLTQTPIGSYAAIVDTRQGPSGASAVLFVVDSDLRLGYYYSSDIRSPNNTLQLNTWMHVAICRSSNTTRLFVDGAQVATATDNDNKLEQNCFIGRVYDGAHNPFIGHIDDLRITKGVARYTSNFSAPVSGFSAPQMGILPPISAGVQTFFETVVGTGDAQLLPSLHGGVSTAVYEEIAGYGEMPPISGGVQSASFFAYGSTLFPSLLGSGVSGAVASASLHALTSRAMAGGAGYSTLPSLVGSGNSGAASASIAPPVLAGTQEASFPSYAIRQLLPEITGFAVLTEGGANQQVGGGFSWIQGTGHSGLSSINQKTSPLVGTASATITTILRQAKELPSIDGVAYGVVGLVARQINKSLPQILGRSNAGATQIDTPKLPMLLGHAEAVIGISGRQTAMPLPMLLGHATSSNEIVGRQVGGTLPLFFMSAPILGAGVLPLLRGIGHASHGTPHAWTLEWAMQAIEAYVMGVDATGDTTAHPVTRYTNYPFVQIIRLGDSYYGVAPNGLHRIGGAQDNGAPIQWAMQTHVTDFGSQFHKTVASAYLGGTIGPSVTFSVLTGEHPEQMHAHANTFTTQLKNHREKFGKGRKARYWAFGLSSSTATSGLMLDALDLEVFEMSRRIL